MALVIFERLSNSLFHKDTNFTLDAFLQEFSIIAVEQSNGAYLKLVHINSIALSKLNVIEVHGSIHR